MSVFEIYPLEGIFCLRRDLIVEDCMFGASFQIPIKVNVAASLTLFTYFPTVQLVKN